ARVKNYERVAELSVLGHRFRNFVEREGCWYWEIFTFLKGKSRVGGPKTPSARLPFLRKQSRRRLPGKRNSKMPENFLGRFCLIPDEVLTWRRKGALAVGAAVDVRVFQ